MFLIMESSLVMTSDDIMNELENLDIINWRVIGQNHDILWIPLSKWWTIISAMDAE